MSNESVVRILGNMIKDSILEINAPTDPSLIDKDHPLISYIKEKLAKRLFVNNNFDDEDFELALKFMMQNDVFSLRKTVNDLIYEYYKTKVIIKGSVNSDRFNGSEKRTRWTF